jgi:transcription factor RLM1
MGRRKIEIRPIKDDRNRSVYVQEYLFVARPFLARATPPSVEPLCPELTVHLYRRTFLKRKGGLFKKAHELSVLCSVDVAVFVFGNNKKLYEYSSVDMNELISRYQYVRVPLNNDLTSGLIGPLEISN